MDLNRNAAPPSAAERLIRLCAQLGIDCIFANLGSDHPAFIEALARLRASGEPAPRVIVCPHEMTALSAAHGYAMVTRRPQLVLVHVDVGTQNLGGSVHNACRGRVPAIVVAGLSPVSEAPDRVGARTEYIHYIQDTTRQHELVAPFMKWSYELRDAATVQAALLRARQIAASEPQGPVYLTGAREVWDEADPTPAADPALRSPVQGAGLAPDAVRGLHALLAGARRALLITTYAGRNPATVERLVAVCERYGVGVVEVGPQYVNFPGDHPCHLGYRRDRLIDEADAIVLVDVDVPWLPRNTRPDPAARVFHLDIDPVKPTLGAWHFGAHDSYMADSGVALAQLLEAELPVDRALKAEREAWLRASAPAGPAATTDDGPLTARDVTLAVKELLTERSVVLCEEPSNALAITSTLRMNRPGSFFSSGGSGLGWSINAAIGAKLARPDAEVIALVGDGCYVFGVPASAYWVAATYEAPMLTVIYNNSGWHSPKASTHLVHPAGAAHAADAYWVAASAGSRLADLGAAAGGAMAIRVEDRQALREALAQALACVRAGRPAVVEAMLAPTTRQSPGDRGQQAA